MKQINGLKQETVYKLDTDYFKIGDVYLIKNASNNTCAYAMCDEVFESSRNIEKSHGVSLVIPVNGEYLQPTAITAKDLEDGTFVIIKRFSNDDADKHVKEIESDLYLNTYKEIINNYDKNREPLWNALYGKLNEKK